MAEPLTATISFDADGVTLAGGGHAITYPAAGGGVYRLVADEAKQKVATIRFTDTGFLFDVTLAGAPCTEQIYTRR